MVHLLFGSLLAAAAVGGVRSLAAPPAPAPDPVPLAADPAEPADSDMALGDAPAATHGSAEAGISGEVLEVIEVPNYSYLRVGEKGTEGTWVAVPTAGLAAGARVRVRGAMKMSDFKSTALGRTFPVIYFGTLDGGGSPRGTMSGGDDDNPHGGMGANPHGGMGASPHGGMGDQAGSSDPHGGMHGADAAAVEVKKAARAEGANGKTVAEVIGQRTSLSGKTVRIRGTVVKVNGGILGRTYLHLRDGSGDAAAATNDIVVTTESTPSLGDTIVIEGVVVTDKDIGAGYKFATMVEDAKVVQ